MPPSSQKVLEVVVPFDSAMNLVKQALQEIPATIQQVDEQEGTILASKGFSMKSFGENIRVWVEQIPDKGSRVRIESESSFPLTLVDWGVNDDNIAAFEGRLAYHLAQQSQPAPQLVSPLPYSGSTYAPQPITTTPGVPQSNYQPPYAYMPRPLKDRSIALILEILPGLFGLLGFGWMYSGNTNTGIAWLIGVLVWDFFAFFLVTLTAGFGLICTIPVNLILVATSASSLNTYTRRHPELFGP